MERLLSRPVIRMRFPARKPMSAPEHVKRRLYRGDVSNAFR
jgi:hypothetical protein